MDKMPADFTVYIAAVAFVAGVGELLLITPRHTLRRWGRALKVTAPLMVGYVAVLASISPLKAGDMFLVLLISVGTVGAIYRMETEDKPWIKPTE
jgi:hypothetical protein